MLDLFMVKGLSEKLLLYRKLGTHLKNPDSLHVPTSNSNAVGEEETPSSSNATLVI